jgi:hypothetical protein
VAGVLGQELSRLRALLGSPPRPDSDHSIDDA